MKTASYLRISVALVTIAVIACCDPVEEPTVNRSKGNQNQINHGEYHTTVTTWTHGDDGNYVGLVTQTPVTDLSKVDVFFVKNFRRIPVDKQFDIMRLQSTHNANEEYFWFSYENNVMLLNYIGLTAASTPPYPLEVIIVY